MGSAFAHSEIENSHDLDSWCLTPKSRKGFDIRVRLNTSFRQTHVNVRAWLRAILKLQEQRALARIGRTPDVRAEAVLIFVIPAPEASPGRRIALSEQADPKSALIIF